MTISTLDVHGNVITDAMWRADWEGTIVLAIESIVNFQLGIEAAGLLPKAITGPVTLSGPESQNIAFVITGTATAGDKITFAAGFLGLAVIVNLTNADLIAGLAAGDTVPIVTGGVTAAVCDGTDFTLHTGVIGTATGAKIIGDLLITTDLAVTEDLTVGGSAVIDVNASVGGTFGVVGTATFDGIVTAVTLSISGNGGVAGNLGVDGTLTGDGEANFVGEGSFGNTVSVTADAATEAAINLDSDAGQGAWLKIYSGGILRWKIGKNLIAEGGGNTGGGLDFWAHDAAGSLVGNILTMNRDGTITFNTTLLPTSAAGLVAGTVWSNAGVLTVA